MTRVKKLDAIRMMFRDWPQTKRYYAGSVEFEQQLRAYIRWRGDIIVLDQKGNSILDNDIEHAAAYSQKLLKMYFPELTKKKRPVPPNPIPYRDEDEEDEDEDDFPGPRPTPIGFDFPWVKDHLLLVILVLALLMFFSRGGLRTVSRLVSGLVSGLLPIVLGAAALFGIIYLIRRGSFGFFRNVRLKPLLIVVAVIAGLVFLYETLGPAAYAAVMNGGLTKLLFFVFTLAASIGILKSKNMGWPIGVKLVVIGVFWLVLLKT